MWIKKQRVQCIYIYIIYSIDTMLRQLPGFQEILNAEYILAVMLKEMSSRMLFLR
jgi:hypothetical protein